MKTFLERDNAVEALKELQEIEDKLFYLNLDGYITDKVFDNINLTESIEELHKQIILFEKEQIKNASKKQTIY